MTEVLLHVAVAAMLWSPEIGLGPGGSGGFAESSRTVVVRLEDVLVLLLGCAWLVRVAAVPGTGLVRRTALGRPILACTLVLATSTLLAMAAGRVEPAPAALYLAKLLEYFVLFVLIVNFVETEAQVRRLLGTAVLTYIAVCAFSAAQIPGGGRVSAPFEGPIGEPNTLGGYLLLLMTLAAGLALEAGRLRVAIAWSALATLGLAPLLATQSRASWLGAVAAMLALLALTRRPRPLALALAALLTAAPFVAPQVVRERIAYTVDGQPAEAGQVAVGGVRLDTSTSARLQSWSQVSGRILAHPLLGTGLTGAGFIDGQYLRVLAEAGLAGAISAAWLVAALAGAGLRAARLRPDPFGRGLAVGYLAGLAGLLGHALGSNTFMLVRVAEPFWLLTGLVVVMGRPSSWLRPSGPGGAPAEGAAA